MAAQSECSSMKHHDLASFIKEFGNDTLKFKLLCFFAAHKHTSMSFEVIAGLLDTAPVKLEEALSKLVDSGILIEYASNGHVIYCLSREYTIQQYMDELFKMDWHSKMRMMPRPQPVPVPVYHYYTFPCG